MRTITNYPIDFIITWVDGSDPKWQEEKNRYKGQSGDNRASRYRDWDTLRYLVRSIEQYAPWVNKVYLVTYGHIPSWINTMDPTLEIVRHEDYLPAEYLPTFSSRTIDMNFHRIKELSEHFVYFNDDMLLTGPVTREDFFHKGLPRDTAVLRPAVVKSNPINGIERTSEMYLAPVIDMALINRCFKKHQAIRSNFWKWYNPIYGKELIKTLSMAVWNFFPGIREYHCCYSYLKSTYKELWELEEATLDEVCKHRFRVNTDYNHWIFSYWQIVSGKFSPRKPSFGFAYALTDDEAKNQKALQAIKTGQHKLVCLNDSVSDINYERVREQIIKELDLLFPQKSRFEK